MDSASKFSRGFGVFMGAVSLVMGLKQMIRVENCVYVEDMHVEHMHVEHMCDCTNNPCRIT